MAKARSKPIRHPLFIPVCTPEVQHLASGAHLKSLNGGERLTKEELDDIRARAPHRMMARQVIREGTN